jgi:hypothetical protein
MQVQAINASLKFSFLLLKSTLFMKKGKMILSALALLVAISAAFAFSSKTLPGDLYYINDQSACVRAPCEITNNTNNACLNSPMFSDNACSNTYGSQAWTTDCGSK